MIKLAPKESQVHELPEPAGGLVLSNETIASIDLDIEIEGGNVKVTVQGIYLGKTEEAPFEATKKKWKLG
jgi:hypothetical protein